MKNRGFKIYYLQDSSFWSNNFFCRKHKTTNAYDSASLPVGYFVSSQAEVQEWRNIS